MYVSGKEINMMVDYEVSHRRNHPDLMQSSKKKASPYRASWYATYHTVLRKN